MTEADLLYQLGTRAPESHSMAMDLPQIAGRTVVVSGAGGSIGSEICRQLTDQHAPARLILLELSEAALFEIDHELNNRAASAVEIIPVLADVRRRRNLRQLFERYDVHLVFHAAAYKHVPMMEHNPARAVDNNILGTVQFAECAREAGVERFIMISTDKAVHPTSVMGATKRIAEIYIQNLASSSDTGFIIVRFGNVLGSSGSVIPILRRQMENGGPLTITHPDMHRYFMTIAEAAHLTLCAGLHGKAGRIHILDMGDPISILAMAESMIAKSGKDIAIEFIGLRPGEKMHEKLYEDTERIAPTNMPGILEITSPAIDFAELKKQIFRLSRIAAREDHAAIKTFLQEILPGYQPMPFTAKKQSTNLMVPLP